MKVENDEEYLEGEKEIKVGTLWISNLNNLFILISCMADDNNHKRFRALKLSSGDDYWTAGKDNTTDAVSELQRYDGTATHSK